MEFRFDLVNADTGNDSVSVFAEGAVDHRLEVLDHSDYSTIFEADWVWERDEKVGPSLGCGHLDSLKKVF